jgi:hypothetical protein
LLFEASFLRRDRIGKPDHEIRPWWATTGCVGGQGCLRISAWDMFRWTGKPLCRGGRVTKYRNQKR